MWTVSAAVCEPCGVGPAAPAPRVLAVRAVREPCVLRAVWPASCLPAVLRSASCGPRVLWPEARESWRSVRSGVREPCGPRSVRPVARGPRVLAVRAVREPCGLRALSPASRAARSPWASAVRAACGHVVPKAPRGEGLTGRTAVRVPRPEGPHRSCESLARLVSRSYGRGGPADRPVADRTGRWASSAYSRAGFAALRVPSVAAVRVPQCGGSRRSWPCGSRRTRARTVSPVRKRVGPLRSGSHGPDRPQRPHLRRVSDVSALAPRRFPRGAYLRPISSPENHLSWHHVPAGARTDGPPPDSPPTRQAATPRRPLHRRRRTPRKVSRPPGRAVPGGGPPGGGPAPARAGAGPRGARAAAPHTPHHRPPNAGVWCRSGCAICCRSSCSSR